MSDYAHALITTRKLLARAEESAARGNFAVALVLVDEALQAAAKMKAAMLLLQAAQNAQRAM